MTVLEQVFRIVETRVWWLVTLVVMVVVVEVTSLSGPNVCITKQKYNITKRVKYRAPMSVRTYEWCFAVPPRCSKWNTEMRDVTRLETEERTAEMAVCCPGFKLKDVSCVPVCPNGKTGPGCSEGCQPNKWGPSCAHECKQCARGSCDPLTGACHCQDGWQGESCETSMTTTAAVAMMEQLLTTPKQTTSTKTTTQTSPAATTTSSNVDTIKTTLSPSQLATIHSESTEKVRTTTSRPHFPLTTKYQESSVQTYTPKPTLIFANATLSAIPTTVNTYTLVTVEPPSLASTSTFSYNRTEQPNETTKIMPTIRTDDTTTENSTFVTITTAKGTSKTSQQTTQATIISSKPISPIIIATQSTSSSRKISKTTAVTTMNMETTKKTETTVRQSSTTKFKPKEIWIRPAQKGDSPIIESKVKSSHELPHSKSKLKDYSEVTTPKTIIVSIIPTSVSYSTFRKMALTTASTSQKNDATSSKFKNNSTEQENTKSMNMLTTSTPFTVKNQPRKMTASTTVNPLLFQNVTKTKSYTSPKQEPFRPTVPTKTTNSMSSTLFVSNKRLNSSLLTTTPSFSINVSTSIQKQYVTSMTLTSRPYVISSSIEPATFTTHKARTLQPVVSKQFVTIIQRNVTLPPNSSLVAEEPKVTKTILRKETVTNSKRNLTNSNTKTKTVTDDPSKHEETFHILTEPEHITAVMGDKGTDRSTIDLISVISIAGGVMMAIITVAVVIVMIERCRRPRYDDVRKYNDIRMQVMIDKNDVPPPYVRSIFHTPLPDPPVSEKCHYQPISTLDRNLKQFMRPVVVQTISPLMLENFRGILECHYDHLPRRSQDLGTMETRCSVAPSIDECEELLPQRVHSLTDSDIEAMKCEAKLDVIDNTTSEPLYAEIPCWRPTTAHAIEVVNLNGEAVTEL